MTNQEFITQLFEEYEYRKGKFYLSKKHTTPISLGDLAMECNFSPSGGWPGLQQSIKDEAERLLRVAAAEDEKPTAALHSPEEYVAMALDNYGLVSKGELWESSQTGMSVPADDVLTLVHHYFYEWFRLSGEKRTILVEQINTAFGFAHIKNKHDRVCKLQERLVYDPALDGKHETILNQILDIFGTPDQLTLDITGEVVENYRSACITAIAHWMWLVKRSLYSQRRKYEMFIVLKSAKQEMGKSWFIRELLSSPFKGFTIERGLGVINDERHFHTFGENFIVMFDELCKHGTGSRGYMEEDIITPLKALITAPNISYRAMNLNKNVTLRNISSLIGTTNKSVAHHFADDTGMRRFFEIDCPRAFDHKEINAVDYLALWKSIDENKDAGYCNPGEDGYSHVRAVQGTYKPHSTVQDFVENWEMTRLLTKAEYTPDLKPSACKLSDLWTDYEMYAKNRGIRNSIKSKTNFGNKLLELTHLYTEQPKKDRPPVWFGVPRDGDE